MIWGHSGPFYIAKKVIDWLQTGPRISLSVLKSLLKGQNGPPKTPMATVWLYSVPLKMVWGYSDPYWTEKMDKI